MKHSKYLLLFLATVFSGCATQMPISEGMVFRDEPEYRSADHAFIDDISGDMMVGYSRIPVTNDFREALINHLGNDSLNIIDDSYLFSQPLPTFAIFYRDRIGLGSTLPLFIFWQVDATVRVYRQYHVTVTGKPLLKNTEIILQRPVLRDREGASASVSFTGTIPSV